MQRRRQEAPHGQLVTTQPERSGQLICSSSPQGQDLLSRGRSHASREPWDSPQLPPLAPLMVLPGAGHGLKEHTANALSQDLFTPNTTKVPKTLTHVDHSCGVHCVRNHR